MVADDPETFADLEGHCYPVCTVLLGAGIGALAGGGAEILHQAFTGEKKIDWVKVGHAAEGGAVAGAITGLAGPGAGLAAKAAIAAEGSIVGGATERALNGENPTQPGNMMIDAAAGMVGARAEESLLKAVPEVTAGWTVKTGAGQSFKATLRTTESAAAENGARNVVRTTANTAAQTAAASGANAAKDGTAKPAPVQPPPPPKPPRPPTETCPNLKC